MRLYNTLSRSLVDLDPPSDKPLKLYTCGPTVYNHATIGNLRTYVSNDILERSLDYLGYRVDRVMNITDVGHLTGDNLGDADLGEDRLDKAAAREGRNVEEIIQGYTDSFIRDCEKINIIIPEKLPRASHYVPQQIELIQKLFEQGFAYDTPEAVYFDTTKFENYGELSGQKLADKSVGAREEVVTGEAKRNPTDFVLWFKLVGRFGHHLMHWPSPWGEGFPGWHLECSALIHTLLGEPIDIHTGGVDHIGTHHTNEIAQSEAAFGVPLAKIWLHFEHLLVDGGRMGKSVGNAYTLSDLIAKGYGPLAFRYLCLQSNYRSKMNFTWESLTGASAATRGLSESLARLVPSSSGSAEETPILLPHRTAFQNALADDLNTPKALAVMYEVLRSPDLSDDAKARLISEFDQVLGLGLANTREAIPAEVMALIQARELCRTNKQFTQSDELRSQILALGYLVEDKPEGPLVLRKS